ncbi:zinc-binding dehydrogenase [Streptomyces sp. L7]
MWSTTITLPAQVAEVAPGGVEHVFGTAGTDKNFAAYAEILQAVRRAARHRRLPVPWRSVCCKSKSISFHWGAFMFTRSLYRTPDQVAQHHILGEIARLVDAGSLSTTATRDLGTIDAAHLREAHRILESGSAIGKVTLTGF